MDINKLHNMELYDTKDNLLAIRSIGCCFDLLRPINPETSRNQKPRFSQSLEYVEKKNKKLLPKSSSLKQSVYKNYKSRLPTLHQSSIDRSSILGGVSSTPSTWPACMKYSVKQHPRVCMTKNDMLSL